MRKSVVGTSLFLGLSLFGCNKHIGLPEVGDRVRGALTSERDPFVQGVMPSFGCPGSDIALSGRRLDPSTEVYLGDVPTSNRQVAGVPGVILADIPEGLSGTVSIRVRNPGGEMVTAERTLTISTNCTRPNFVPPPAAPPDGCRSIHLPPRDFEVTAESPTEVRLTWLWRGVTWADQIRIVRETYPDPSSRVDLVTLPGGAQSYVDSTVQPGRNYHYQLLITGLGGTCRQSLSDHITTPYPSAPVPPPPPPTVPPPPPSCGSFVLTPAAGPSGTMVRLESPGCRGIDFVTVSKNRVGATITREANSLFCMDVAVFQIVGTVGSHAVEASYTGGCTSAKHFEILAETVPPPPAPRRVHVPLMIRVPTCGEVDFHPDAPVPVDACEFDLRFGLYDPFQPPATPSGRLVRDSHVNSFNLFVSALAPMLATHEKGCLWQAESARTYEPRRDQKQPAYDRAYRGCTLELPKSTRVAGYPADFPIYTRSRPALPITARVKSIIAEILMRGACGARYVLSTPDGTRYAVSINGG